MGKICKEIKTMTFLLLDCDHMTMHSKNQGKDHCFGFGL
jgi:hypothetical protein